MTLLHPMFQTRAAKSLQIMSRLTEGNAAKGQKVPPPRAWDNLSQRKEKMDYAFKFINILNTVVFVFLFRDVQMREDAAVPAAPKSSGNDRDQPVSV